MIADLDPRVRAALVAVGAAAFALLVTQFLLPGSGGGRGTPTAILVAGLVQGLLNALTAAGIILVYRSTRVINFAQTAIGAAGGELTFQLLQLTRVPFVIAFPAGLLAAGLAGLVFDVAVGRRFFRAPRLVLTVATIAAAGLLSVSSRRAVNALPFFPRTRTLEQLQGAATIRGELPFAAFQFHIGGLPIPFGFAEILAVEVALLALFLVGGFFRYTRAGVAVRAVAENAERAALLGVSTGALSSIVWTLAAVLSGVGIILTGAISNPSAAAGIAPTVLLPALAAAVLARMTSLPVAVGSSLLLGMLTRAAIWSFNDDQPLIDVALFLIIAVGLLVQRSGSERSEEGGGQTWEATQEERPVPRELASLPSLRAARYVAIAVGLVLVVGYPFLVSPGATVLGGVIALNAIVALSVVVLTGWAGQVSLGQFAFAAVGAVVGGALTAKVGVPFWFAVPIAAGVTGGFAALVGIPALRIKGLFLAITTFAFAVAVGSVLFNRRYFGWLLPTVVERPSLVVIDFEDERSMYYLCVAALVASAVVVTNLRRSRFGRILIAVRDNQANVQAFGARAVRAKLAAFALSGALAGFAGAIFAHQQRGLSGASFLPQRSVDLFLLAVLGGITSVTGALLGSAYFNASTYFFPGNIIFDSLQPFAVLMLLFIAPGGLVSLVNKVRDAVLRIVAQRRHLVVPSLFADRDPYDLEAQLVPLGPDDDDDGLALLPPDVRFDLPSTLYGGEPGGDAQQRSRRRDEVDALQNAARTVSDAPA
jgi:branched-chain amino acid transport system permease protein